MKTLQLSTGINSFGLPGVNALNLAQLGQRRAVEMINAAHRDADAESTKTIREAYEAAQIAESPASVVVTTSWPPPSAMVGLLLMLMILVGGIWSLGRSGRGGVAGGVEAVDASTMATTSEWRDGVEEPAPMGEVVK